jgi:hypothetical protein
MSLNNTKLLLRKMMLLMEETKNPTKLPTMARDMSTQQLNRDWELAYYFPLGLKYCDSHKEQEHQDICVIGECEQ